MPGRKVFTAGEVLTAADVNGYLMDQSVMRFATEAARGSAIAAPTEGMVTFIDADDSVQVYTGSAWVTYPRTIESPLLVTPIEPATISATGFGGTVTVDALTAPVYYSTGTATGNWTLNVRGDASTTLASTLAVGQAVTVVAMATNGTTPYYGTAVTVDGTAVTPKWQFADTPDAGNASSVDVYAFTVIKTAATPTYAVFGSMTRFA